MTNKKDDIHMEDGMEDGSPLQMCASGAQEPALTSGSEPSAQGSVQRLMRFMSGETTRAVYWMSPKSNADALRDDVRALYDLMIRWRVAAQRWTPGGSEYMDPAYCERFIQERREEAHRTKVELHRVRAALAQVEAQ